MQTQSPDALLQQARRYLTEYGDSPTSGLAPRLLRSWQRSLAAGLRPADCLRDSAHVDDQDLRQILNENHELLAHSQPVMEYLFDQVRDSQSMVILADHRGTLMHTVGHADFLDKAQQVALTCGASWLEQHRGTNAIGTALAERESVEVRGAEHFIERNAFLTCTAAPILSARGELMGILDISGDCRSGHPHTLGLVNMATRMIENSAMLADQRRGISLHLHAQREGIGTVAEGIVLLSDDGWIVGANRRAMALLDLSPADLNTRQLAQLVHGNLDLLLATQRRRLGQPTQLQLRNGATLYGLLQFPPEPLRAAPAKVPTASHADALAEMDTGDAHWRNACDKVRRVLDKPIAILIQGESGVGKEMFARAAHASSPRRHKPFVAINCAAIPENLIEAELFGYAPGAFTGARREGSAGRLREAHGGTLFLDEIGDMPLAMQARLLRVLQERQVSPLGGGPTVAVDFGLMCASHRALRDEIAHGRFRSDLYYRINGLTVLLPVLRERSDFLVLTERLLAELNPARSVQLAPELLARLRRYAWPGNLRQYANVLRTASAMLDSNEDWIEEQHLPDDLVQELDLVREDHVGDACRPRNLQDLACQAMRQAIEGSGGNWSQAARSLGISRQTLYRRLKA